MGIAIPMLLLLLFGYALTLDVDNVPLVVWDQSGVAGQQAARERFPRFALLLTAGIRSQLPGSGASCRFRSRLDGTGNP